MIPIAIKTSPIIIHVGIVFYTIQNPSMIGDTLIMNIAMVFGLVAGIGIVMATIHKHIK